MIQVVSVAVLFAACRTDHDTCSQASQRRNWQTAKRLCLKRYRGGDVRAGALAARSQLEQKEFPEAERLSKEVLARGANGDAQMVLGDLAVQAADRDIVAGLAHYREALAVFRALLDHGGASRAAQKLARAYWASGEPAGATWAAELALEEAERGGDLVLQYSSRLAYAFVLRQQGLWQAAEQELTRAAALAREHKDHAWVAMSLMNLYVDQDLDSLAAVEAHRVLALAKEHELSDTILLSTYLNLAWIDRRAGDLGRASADLDEAAKLAPDDVDLFINRARVLDDLGRLDEAAAELARATALEDERDNSWLFYNQGLIAQRRGDHDGELAAFHRASEIVRDFVSRSGEYASDAAASNRQPFLRLLGIHARGARWRDALEVVMQLDQLALVSNDRETPSRPSDVPSPPARSTVSLQPLPTSEAVLAAWRGRDLVILISDEHLLWRLSLRDGALTGEPVGPISVFEALASALERDPSDRAAAAALGAAFIPPRLGASLDLLLVGPIARAPLAALTRDGRPIADSVALSRVLALLPRQAAPSAVSSPGSALVLGDPRDDLPSARAEATAVAAALATRALLGEQATSTALYASSPGILHIAAHSRLTLEGPVLLLADRAVTRKDLLTLPRVPSLVVLASCGSAVARDDAGWGSLAAAFLTAGADTVLASSSSIDDGDTRRFVDALYRDPALLRAHPARALAAAQAAARATLPPRAWASFTAITAPPRFSAARL